MSERVKSNTRASVLRVDEARVHEAQGGDLQVNDGHADGDSNQVEREREAEREVER